MKRPSTRKEQFKLGFVTAVAAGNGRWKFRWLDSTSRDVRRVVPAADLEQAIELAKAYNVEIATGHKIPGMHKFMSGFTIHEAIAYWLKNQTEIKQKTQDEYRGALNGFGTYLAAAHPGITHWEKLQPEYVKTYMKSLDGLSYSTRRRRLVVLKMISRDLHRMEEERYCDFAGKAFIKLKQPAQESKPHPTNRQVYHLKEWFRRRYPALSAMLVLECHAGLRGFEAAFLRVQDVDFRAGTIAIVPTEHYSLKNNGSMRVIPVTPVVLSALKEYLAQAAVQSATADGTFFLNHCGEPWTESGICTSRNKAMKAYRAYLAEKQLRGAPADFMLRELRSVFVSNAIRAGVSELLLQKYIGHSGGSVMRKHYIRLTIDDLRLGVVDKLATFSATYRQIRVANI